MIGTGNALYWNNRSLGRRAAIGPSLARLNDPTGSGTFTAGDTISVRDGASKADSRYRVIRAAFSEERARTRRDLFRAP